MPDYTDQLIPGGAAAKADAYGEAAAAGAAQDAALMMPALAVPLDYAQKRADWFQQKMAEHLAKGQPGVYGDLQNTYAYVSMKKQMQGYARDTMALQTADSDYTLLVGPANSASKAIVKQQALEGQLGFTDDTDFEKQLTPKQAGALKKTMRNNPALLAKTQAVQLAGAEYDTARQTLMAATHGFSAVLTGQVIVGLNAKKQEATDKKEEINAKIEKVKKYAEYVETGLKVVAMAAGGGPGGVLAPGGLLGEGTAVASEEGMVTDYAAKTKEWAEKGEKGVGAAATAAGVAMQLYYQKDLDALNGQINSISSEVSAYQEVQTAQQILAAKTTYDAASSNFRNAADKYRAAVDDRRTSYLELGRMADASLNGGKEDGKHDFVQQVLLYMESVREARSLIMTAQSSATTAQGALDGALTSMQHRGEAYQTNYESSGTVQLADGIGPDGKTVQKMKSLTLSWMTSADAMKQKLDKQETSAQKMMGNF